MRASQVEGKQIHAVIINLGFERVIFLQTSLINMYSSSGNLVDAHHVFDEVSCRNVICWTTMISAYVDNGKPSRALKLFKEMKMENVEPDQVTVTVALSACADLGALEMGAWIHSYIRRKRGFRADLCLNNAILNMYVKCGDVGAARRMFDGLSRRDVTTWTSMIVGHALHGEAEEALKLFTVMTSKKKNVRKKYSSCRNGLVLPNEVTFIGVLMACSHAGMVEEGWQHWESMSKIYGLKPRISHYGCMVDLLCRAGLLKEAYDFIVNMPIQPNAIVWRTLLGACSIHGNIELGADVRHRLLELDPNYVGDDVTMSNTYASAGMWDEKIATRAQIKHRRVPGCSSIQLGNTKHQFVAADKNHQLRREMCTKDMTYCYY
ncbi:Pentatricopeptide repeat-containing protein [Thalictrum thalictroides]|uniref:Pentatricopeptide repeat-containing protein n=1 Tax=Thalictrum thalictroides TaxID=46969 RepID=A0A7J6VYA9_THATH|nr:Pentatricopeptide repeat-containing protein [Thalictrum thalictroides]